MRLDEIEEAEVKKAVFTFGRLNPPHYGHHALIQTLQKTAEKQGCDWYLFVSSKTGDEKNPLTYEQKVWWIQTLFPEVKDHLVVDPSIKTPLVAATWLYKQGYRAATFVAGEDDMSSYGEMIKSGNAHGQKNPDAVGAGKGFIFNPLDFAISPRLASATNARKNVSDGDPEAFVRSILGPKISPDLAKLVHDQLYPTVRKALGLTESVDKDKQPKESAELSKSTPSVADLAKKYATDSAKIHHQVNRGVKVEFEHTNDIEAATEIAMDHLGERLDYYDLLDKLEKTPKKKFGENFADGKGPGKPGDSQRHGIPKKASISQLEKASHAKGRKGQLARWQLNMRRGKKANEDGTFPVGNNPDGGGMIDRQVAIMPQDVETPRRSSEVIDEVADQPYRYMLAKKLPHASSYIFQSDSGSRFGVFIELETWSYGTVADVGFSDQTDRENPTIGVTGKGDAFRVFATVGAIVKEYVKSVKPDFMTFSGKASEPGRVKLYDMISKNIGRYLPGYELSKSRLVHGSGGSDKTYTFKKAGQASVSANPMKVPKDAERHATQAALAQQQGGVRKEPVIGKMTPQGFELIEGWHRTIQHFKQFPDGYAGPAWVAMNAVSESITEDESARPLVYLDMDGVLADFFGEWSKLAGVNHYKDIDNAEEKLQLVRDHPTFWIDLPLLPHARALVKTVIDKYGEYRICSTPLAGDERSKPGKIAWIQKHFSDMPPAEIVLTHSKADRALGQGAPNILVDDYGVNINKWRAAGGIGIKYDDSAFPQVAKILVSIAKSGVSK